MPEADVTRASGCPTCPECHQPLTYDLPHNRWDCATHGPQWTGDVLAQTNKNKHA